jgi:hypothetical protein
MPGQSGHERAGNLPGVRQRAGVRAGSDRDLGRGAKGGKPGPPWPARPGPRRFRRSSRNSRAARRPGRPHAYSACLACGLRPASVVTLKDIPRENASWLADTVEGSRLVLRRYHAAPTERDLAYEHAVLRRLALSGCVVPAPVGEIIREAGRYYSLTRYVPGRPAVRESVARRRRRGRDLARLDLALRDLGAPGSWLPPWPAPRLACSA